MLKTPVIAVGAVLLLLGGCQSFLELDRFSSPTGEGGAGGSVSTGGGDGGDDCTDGCLVEHQLFGGNGADLGRALARTENGIVVFAEYGLDFSVLGTPFPTGMNTDLALFEVGLDLESVSWTRPMVGNNVDNAQAAIVHDEDIYVCGAYTSPLEALPQTTDLNGFAARLDPTGQIRWMVPVVSTGRGRCNSIAVTTEGVFLAGNVTGDVTTPSGIEGRPDAGGDIYIARLNVADGSLESIVFGDDGGASFHSISWIAPAADGARIVAAGRGRGASVLEGHVLGASNQDDTVNAYVFEWDPLAESVTWSRSIAPQMPSSEPPEPWVVVPEQVAVDAAGDVHVVGYFHGQVDFGEGLVTSSGDDGFYLRVQGVSPGAGPPGAFLASKIMTGDKEQSAHAVAVNPNTGEVAVGLHFLEDINIEGQARTDATNAKDGGVARFSPTGDLLRFHHIAGTGDDIIWGVTFDGDDIVATGHVGSDVVVDGAQSLGPGFGDLDVFVGRFAAP